MKTLSNEEQSKIVQCKCSCDCDPKCCSEENCDSSNCKCKERPEYDVVNYWQDEELKPERKTTH